MQQLLLRTLLAIAASEDWKVEQGDIKTTFLYVELDEDIYTKKPDGSMHKLQRAIYGLKQAGRQWHKKFSKSLIDLGFPVAS